jgi:diketogulonate reductase-like aldo/keto reductase
MTAIVKFVEQGGRRLDTSLSEENHKFVGQGVAALGLREKVFITSKVAGKNPYGYFEILDQAQRVLQDLQTDYIDLLLLHNPDTYPAANTTDTKCCDGGDCTHHSEQPWGNTFASPQCRRSAWHAMQHLLKTGVAKAIGISNFMPRHIEDILAAGAPYPDVHQMEYHPYYHDDDTLDKNIRNCIVTNAYATMGANDWTDTPMFPNYYVWKNHSTQKLLDQYHVQKYAHAHEISAAQLLIKWAWQSRARAVVNPRTRNYHHMRENLEALAGCSKPRGCKKQLSGFQIDALNYLPREGRIGPDTSHVN